MKTINLNLSEEQFRDLLICVLIGSWVKESVLSYSDENYGQIKIDKLLLNIAKQEKLDELFEEFNGEILPSNLLADEAEKIIDDFSEDEFWHNLVIYLGKRDFWRTVNGEEAEEIAKSKIMPKRIDSFYKKYEDEFAQHGIERLEINENY